MKKIFFCLFSSIFVAILLWLGMYGEVYGYYTNDTDLHYIATNRDSDYKNLFKNCSNFSDIMSVLQEINIFTDRTNRDLELFSYAELFSENYCYTIDTKDSSSYTITLFFNISSNSHNCRKYDIDTNGLNIYYTSPRCADVLHSNFYI